MRLLALVGAGIVGAIVRYGTEVVTEHRAGALPWGVFGVNVAGALLLGLLVAEHEAGRVSPEVLLVAGTGFCGSLTTFSAFAIAMVRLARQDRRLAIAFVILMLVAGGVAAAGGTVLAGVL